LVVTGDAGSESAAVAGRFGDLDGTEVEIVDAAADATAALGRRSFDCMLVDLDSGESDGLAVLKWVRARTSLRTLPVVVGGARELSPRGEARLRQYADTMTLARPRTGAELAREIALFLHRSDADLPDDLRTGVGEESDQVFAGRKLLIVDDDVRNVFALASALERRGLEVLYAENGETGLETLRREPDIELVLMDVMMPGMDGYTAMREIRGMPSLRDLPIIALTAKAMPGDRDNSLTAGASDYVTKPVDIEQLLSVIRSWLS
jgi:CheY-like chemotaxis protein